VNLEFGDNFNTGSLGSQWSVYDCTGTAGASASVVSQQLRLQGAGTDIWESEGTSVDYYISCYLTQAVHGDFDAIVRVVSQSNIGETWSKAGIMIKNNMQQSGSSAGYSIIAATPGSGFTFQWDSDGDGYLDSNIEDSLVIPTYLKMSRRGYRFMGYYSVDKVNWTQVYYASISQANAAVHVGLFNTSHRTGVANVTVMDNFELWTGKGRFFNYF
jgi:hypothetical protein